MARILLILAGIGLFVGTALAMFQLGVAEAEGLDDLALRNDVTLQAAFTIDAAPPAALPADAVSRGTATLRFTNGGKEPLSIKTPPVRAMFVTRDAVEFVGRAALTKSWKAVSTFTIPPGETREIALPIEGIPAAALADRLRGKSVEHFALVFDVPDDDDDPSEWVSGTLQSAPIVWRTNTAAK
ncbi:MAG: hypothetical protein QM811_26310 [Pirellulales bacterium]